MRFASASLEKSVYVLRYFASNEPRKCEARSLCNSSQARTPQIGAEKLNLLVSTLRVTRKVRAFERLVLTMVRKIILVI